MKKVLYFFAILVVLLAIAQTFNLLPKINLEKYVSIPKPSINIPVTDLDLSYNESIITSVIEKSIPSVVTIAINKTTTTPGSIQINPLDRLNPIKKIPGEKKEIHQNIGSGFLISEDGLILTNKHVVADEQATYSVLTYDKKEFSVESILKDPLNDMAILKINAKNLTSLVLGDSSTLKLGQIAIAIGTPLGEYTNTVTSGIISGLGRGITAGSPFEGAVEQLNNVIQTDAAISPGNSGGPLLNSRGEVIGINTAIAQEGQNIGFAIPSNVAAGLVDEFKTRGSTFERPFLGVRYSLITKQDSETNNLPEGAFVVRIIKGSPAEESGLQEEDIILSIDNQKINAENQQTLNKIIFDKKIGQKITLEIYRAGKRIKIQATLKKAS